MTDCRAGRCIEAPLWESGGSRPMMTIVELSRHPIDPETLLCRPGLECFLRKRQEPRKESTLASRFLVAFAQPVEGVLTYRPQHLIASHAVVLLGEDEALVCQGRSQAGGV